MAGFKKHRYLTFPRRHQRKRFWQVSWLVTNTIRSFPPPRRQWTTDQNVTYSCGAASASNGIPFSSLIRDTSTSISMNSEKLHVQYTSPSIKVKCRWLWQA